MPSLFVYQINSFSTGHMYLPQRNSFLVATKWGMGISCSDDQWIISYQKVSFSYNLRNLMVYYADVMTKKFGKRGHRS